MFAELPVNCLAVDSSEFVFCVCKFSNIAFFVVGHHESQFVVCG